MEQEILRTLLEIAKQDHPEFEEEHTTGWDLIRNAEIWLDKLEHGRRHPATDDSILPFLEIREQALLAQKEITAFPFDAPSFQYGAEWAREEILTRLGTMNKEESATQLPFDTNDYWQQIQNEVKPQQ
jgi:hypothetical protein